MAANKPLNIVARCDKGEHPEAIAEAEGVTLGYVHQILRKYRPKRARKPREKTSAARAAILFYAMVEKLPPAEIVAKMKGKCSRQLVYRELKAAESTRWENFNSSTKTAFRRGTDLTIRKPSWQLQPLCGQVSRKIR